MLLDVFVQTHQVLLDLEMLIYFYRLFKTSLDLIFSLLALNELLNRCRWPFPLCLLALLATYLCVVMRGDHLLGRQHGPVIEVGIWSGLIHRLFGSLLYAF